MNKGEPVNIGGYLEAEALRILRSIPGVDAVIEEPSLDRSRADAVIRYAGSETPVVIEFKRHANAAAAWQVVQYADALEGAHMLLIAGGTTADARRILDENGVAVIDGLGNAHLQLPGLLMRVEGRGRPGRLTGPIPPTRLRGKAAVVTQALLLDPRRAWHVQDLAEDANVSRGLAHRVLARLETEGIATAEGTGPSRTRTITNPAALLDLWGEENVDKPFRVLGYVLAQSPNQLITELGRNLEARDIEYAFTGAAAGSVIAPFITAVPVVEAWVSATVDPTKLYTATKAEPVTDGNNVIFLQGKDDAALRFRQRLSDVWLANLFRVYVDMRADPRRGREQADHLRAEAIGF